MHRVAGVNVRVRHTTGACVVSSGESFPECKHDRGLSAAAGHAHLGADLPPEEVETSSPLLTGAERGLQARAMRRAVQILALAALLVGVAWATGLLGELTDPELIRRRVVAAGAWGPFLFILLAVASFAVFMLAPVIWVAGALWSLPEAFSYSWIAAMIGSVGTYVITRQLGRSWARERIPASIRLWEERLEARPFATVMALRLLLWANPLVDMLVAVTGIPVRIYLIGTTIGMLVPTVFHVLVGAGGVEMLNRMPWWGWAIVVAVIAIGVVIYRYRVRVRRQQTTSDAAD